jgi:hypothetical protein
MELIYLTVRATGVGANAHLATDATAEHCALTPRARRLHGYASDTDGSCLATAATSAIAAARQALIQYERQVAEWRDRLCGCPNCLEGTETIPLFQELAELGGGV